MTEQSKNNNPLFGSRTDVGYVRKHNEDSLLSAPPLFVVCDGMGGHEAGEVASEIAVNVVANRAPHDMSADALGQAVEEANLAIIQAAAEGIGKDGMGTTCTAAMLDGEHLIVAQVGDSRAYLLHNGKLQQLTRDHSVVADLVETGEIAPEEARTHQWRSYITRALGLDPYMQADLYELGVNEGDRLMLCSDGLYSMVPDEGIEAILGTASDPQQAADALVEEALKHGGTDNITVIVADATGFSPKTACKIERKAKVTAIVIIALMAAIIAGTVIVFNAWVSNAAYLGSVDGKVAVYSGVPGEFAGISFSHLEKVTDIDMSDLQPGTATRIEDGSIKCDSLDDAYNLIDQYAADISKKKPQGQESANEAASSASSDASSPSQNASRNEGNG